MKTKLIQFISVISRIDQRYLKFAYFALVLIVSAILKAPSDGGTDPYKPG